MIAKCPNCGGALEYDIITDKMSCSHCMASFMVGELKMRAEKQDAEAMKTQSVNAHEAQQTQTDMSDEWMRRTPEELDTDEMMECNIYNCTACGAELMINDVESSTYCAYCSQPTVVFNRVAMHKRPKLIIPFKVSKNQALSIIRNRLNKGAFVPQEIKNFKVDILRGIYVPYWMVDIDYNDSQMIKGKVKSGKNTVTRYFYRKGEARFRRVPVDASKRFNDYSSQRLEPFDRDGFVDFNPQYLSGFYSDCSDEEAGAVDYKASFRAKEMFDMETLDSVNASSKKIIQRNPQFRVNEKTYAMMPVWFMVFKYIGMPYTIMVNGQTGKMVGAVPFDKKKVITFFLSFAFVFSAIAIMLINQLFSLVPEDGDSQSSIFTYSLVIAFICVSAAVAKYKSYKRSRELTQETQIKRYVSDRQEGM